MINLSFVLCLLLAWFAIHFLVNARKGNGSNPRKLPPGPPTLPIFGNLFSLGTKPHVSLTELAKTYGPLMSLQLGQMPTVVVSSAVMAREALQKNDLSLCNRPVIDAVRALNHQQASLIWLSASPLWRNFRKICKSEVFSADKIDASQSVRRRKVRDLLDYVQKQSFAGSAVDIGQAAFTTTLNLLSSTFFSIELGDPSSELASEFRKTIRGIMEEVGKPNFADYFPVLQKIDPQGTRRRISVHFKKMIDLFNTMIEERLQGKRPPGSIQGNDVLDAILRINQEKPEEIQLSAISHLLLDSIRLPYLQAVIKETFRLHPPAPLLVPRKADLDIKLFDFTVPKGTHVMVNVWAIGRDPDLWENPNSFEPERFMGSHIDVKGSDFELIPFGAGRRICPGLPLAIRMIHLMLGSLIHEFDWKLEGGIPPENMDMEERYGITMEKSQRLKVVPALRI